MRWLAGVAGSVGMLLAVSAVQAQGAATAPPRQIALCATCHGTLGLGNTPDAPHLAGQPRVYLVTQLKAFRSGARRHEVMSVIAKPLSDEDIDVVADWFSSVLLDVHRP